MAVRRIPELALPAEHLPEHPPRPRAIVWSRAEFCVASEALPDILQEPERKRRPPANLKARGVDLLELASVPEQLRQLLLWFEGRYRAHAPGVALLHLDRFLAITAFLQGHEERLRRDGLVTTRDDGARFIDEYLLGALVGVDYRPGFLGSPPEPCIGRYEDIVALTNALASGQVPVVEFVRTPPAESDTDEAWAASDAGASSRTAEERDAFELEDFEEAMEEWYGLSGRPESELRPEAALFLSTLGCDLGEPFGRSPALTLLLRWFLERFENEDAHVMTALLFRFMVMAGFIEQHLDRLVELGFLEPHGQRYVIAGSLFSALNNLPVQWSDPGGGAEPFDFGNVIEVATAHRELLGDARILKSAKVVAGGRPAAAPGRNEPCPCRSGRKFKRCCGPRMN